jgi:hypothetical protein
LPKYLRGVHGIEWEDAAPARGRRGGGRAGLRASGRRMGPRERQGRRAAGGSGHAAAAQAARWGR